MKDITELEHEKRLIEAAQQDNSKFIELYDKYYDQIYRYVARRVNNHPDTAHDIVSDTFLDALKNLKKFKWMGYPFSSWLYKIAHNNVIKWYRRNEKEKSIPLEKAYGIHDESADQKDKMEQNIASKQLNKMMKKLTMEEREILRLKYFEGVSNVEIADIMGLSVTNIGVRVFRTLKKAKGLLPHNSELKKLK